MAERLPAPGRASAGAPAPAPAAPADDAPAAPRRDRGPALRRALAAVALAGLLAVAGLAAVGMAGEPRNSVHLDGPHGLGLLAQALREDGLRVEGLGAGPHALDAVEDPGKAVLLVSGVERSYTAAEVAAIAGFVARGGTAVVADDFTSGDAVGHAFGVNFDRRVLRDAAFEGNLSLVRVNATLAGQNWSLLTNTPASLGFAPGVDAERIAESGLDSYIDLNQDGVEDPGDAKGPFPVIAAVRSGAGRAVFVSDPGMLANQLWDENGAFLRAFFRELLPDGGTVVVDESRHPVGPAAALPGALLAGVQQASGDPALAAITGAGAVVLAGALWTGFRAPPALAAHRPALDEPLHVHGNDLRRERLRRLAMAAVADANNLGLDAFEQATPAQLAGMARDPALAALIRGEAPKLPDEELARRIAALRAAGNARGGAA